MYILQSEANTKLCKLLTNVMQIFIVQYYIVYLHFISRVNNITITVNCFLGHLDHINHNFRCYTIKLLIKQNTLLIL